MSYNENSQNMLTWFYPFNTNSSNSFNTAPTTNFN